MSADHSLSMALAAQRYVDSRKRVTPHGIAWGHSRELPDTVSHSLYNGSSGIFDLLSGTVCRNR
ncbi:MAG: hypothetical protein HC809_08520 [Gammaproteobacteria bacterium]|nr:hypothetical protein [Gammaproteobacteria bacterium]